YAICFFQLFASVPQYFNVVCHFNEDTIGLILALNGLIVVLVEMPLIGYLQKHKDIFSFIIGAVLCIPVAFLILQFGRCLIVSAEAYTLFITMAEFFAMPLMMNFSLSRAKKERQGKFAALYSIGFGIENFVAPPLGLGIAGKFGFDTMFETLIAVSILI